MAQEIVKLGFVAPLHISNPRSDYAKSQKTIGSDTLVAALMDAWAKIGKVKWIEEYADLALASKTPFALSNALPFHHQNGKDTFFMPKPYRFKLEDNFEGQGKTIKKLQYLDLDAFFELLQGKLVLKTENIHGAYYLSNHGQEFNPNFISHQIQNRIMRPRNDEDDAKPFIQERLFFTKGSGLFSLIDYSEKIWLDRIKVAFTYLSDAGLGTDRNIGNGQFECEFISYSTPPLPRSNYGVALSFYGNLEKELVIERISNDSGFELQKRGGWIGEPFNSLRKRSVQMFRSGSVFYFKNGIQGIHLEGSLFNLQPEILKNSHPVYRSGYCIILPISI